MTTRPLPLQVDVDSTTSRCNQKHGGGDLGLARLLSSCSIGSESNPPCPLCLDPMTAIDHQHPLMCPTRHCHYNFCASCIESLISSSKDGYEMASDGNAHVKVFLNCPNCRADLSHSIRDVLLLRKVDTVAQLTMPGDAAAPVRLTPSQERTRAAMQELDVQETIQNARDAEASFWRQYSKNFGGGSDARASLKSRMASAASSRRRSSLLLLEESIQELSTSTDTDAFDEQESDEEEWGVEADLVSGVHNSIRLPHGHEVFSYCSSTNENKHHGRHKKKAPDVSLFYGLEYSMMCAEKFQVTQWMTSGSTTDLVLAARKFEKLEQYARQGVPPAKRQAYQRRGTVFDIVEETRKVREEEEKRDDQEKTNANAGAAAGAPTRGGRLQSRRNNNNNGQIVAERRQLEKAVGNLSNRLERFPLPVRMPKCVELELRGLGANDIYSLVYQFPLQFCNDTWDGTVLDAYSKLTITGGLPNCTVTKKKTQHAGVYKILSLGKYTQHYGPIEMTLEHPPRVLVASVQGEGGRKGIIKGDVVTHLDGEEFHGTVDDLLKLLHAKAGQQQSKVEMILNAESSVAEALRRRAMVLE